MNGGKGTTDMIYRALMAMSEARAAVRISRNPALAGARPR